MKKYVLLLVLLTIMFSGFSQTINFTDFHLKNVLLNALPTNGIASINSNTINAANVTIDTSGDGEIQVSEALVIDGLTLYSSSINDLAGLEYFANLKSLDCSGNPVATINIVLPSLKYLICQSTGINQLNLSVYPELVGLNCRDNLISNLDFSGLPLLEFVGCGHNLLTSLDFSNNPKFFNLGCGFNPSLTNINIKNGFQYIFTPGLLFDDGWINNPNLTYICADDNEINDLTSFWNNYHPNQNVSINSYCSFAPGGTFYTIQGTSKYDSNNNGCDAMDASVPFMKINVTDGTVSGSVIATLGNYTFPVQAGSYTLTPIIQQPSYFNISPATATVAFPTTASPHTQDFCLEANGVHNDLEVTVLSFGIAAGSDAQYGIVFKNNGTSTQSGTVNLTFDDSVLDYVSASPTVGSQSVSNLNWNFSNLLPFESREIWFKLNANSPTSNPPLNLGDIVTTTASITAATDETPADNVFVLNQTVVNSFDPNDKTCLEGNSIVPAKVGDYVHYMIRFENNGTANAQNIVVKDLIDTTKFDIDSLFPISGSHNFTTRINGNAVEFVFQNINLPFATGTNDGYIAFKIKTKSTLTLGNSFSNSANIYFDYNLPIVTNTATTTVANPLVNQDFEFSNYFSLYPNPVKNSLNITNKNNLVISSISIYNTLGQLVQTITNPSTNNDVSGLKSGTYFVKMVTDNGVISSKFVKE